MPSTLGDIVGYSMSDANNDVFGALIGWSSCFFVILEYRRGSLTIYPVSIRGLQYWQIQQIRVRLTAQPCRWHPPPSTRPRLSLVLTVVWSATKHSLVEPTAIVTPVHTTAPPPAHSPAPSPDAIELAPMVSGELISSESTGSSWVTNFIHPLWLRCCGGHGSILDFDGGYGSNRGFFFCSIHALLYFFGSICSKSNVSLLALNFTTSFLVLLSYL